MSLCCLKYFGVIFADDSTRDTSVDRLLYHLLLLAASSYNLCLVRTIGREFDDWSDVLSSSMSALTCLTVAAATIASTLVSAYNAVRRHGNRKYRRTLESFDIYTAADAAASRRRVLYSSLVSVLVCVAIVLPTNVAKLWAIYTRHPNPLPMTTFFFLYYFQNLSMWCTELHFAIQCFVVGSRFRSINDEFKRVSVDHGNHERAAVVIRRRRRRRQAAVTTAPPPPPPPRENALVYERDFYRPRDDDGAVNCYDGGACRHHSALANTVELLRIEHWLTREAVSDLNGLFRVKLGLSVFCIITAVTFDVYTVMFYAYTSAAAAAAAAATVEKDVFRSNELLVGWVLQYSYRFFLIVFSAHTTTKQAVKTKSLVTEMNNQQLDTNTREELQIFYNQLSNGSIKLTICDIFTLNNRLFTSVLTILATYILVLVQFQKDSKV